VFARTFIRRMNLAGHLVCRINKLIAGKFWIGLAIEKGALKAF
jgi:hypothetical protein